MVTLLGACAVLFMLGSMIVEEIASYISFCIRQCAGGASFESVLYELLTQAVMVLLKTAFPGLLVTGVCAVIATFFQTRMLVSGELLKPKFNRINPIEGFKRLFSLRSIVEALKGILKISILMVLIYMSLNGSIQESSRYLYTDIATACAHLFDNGKSMIIKIVIAFVVIAAADYMYQWWNYERQLRMTKQEVKDEYKQVEGDPKVKGRIREIQRQRAQTRMMQQVPQADVVVRNPTHFAVALRYRPEQDGAPIVLAKGQDELALRIVRVAEEAGVTVMENVSLARALYAQAELNQEIPHALYEAVAEVLVYIFRLNEEKKLVK